MPGHDGESRTRVVLSWQHFPRRADRPGHPRAGQCDHQPRAGYLLLLPPAAPASSSTNPSAGSPSGGAAGFAPYVDTSLYPPFSLVSTAQATGVKQFNLAFVVAAGSGGCTPEWGGVTAIGADPVAAQIGALRAIGGDVRISFGGQAGSELAITCTSVSQLQAAYQQVISAYDVNKIDFDIEGAAVDNTAANARRDQALAALQAQNPGLQVSFTLPVLPSGLTADGDAVLTGAAQAGVKISAVNVMAMDYGDGAAPNPSGQLGTFAIDAATATDAQVASALGISADAAWSKVAVTPMIGVNDTSDEVFTVANAQQLAAFAASKHLAWLSMWSAARDTECPGGAQSFAQPTCSSIAADARSVHGDARRLLATGRTGRTGRTGSPGFPGPQTWEAGALSSP